MLAARSAGWYLGALLAILATARLSQADDDYSAPPTPADKALEMFVVHSDFTIELVAAEPMVMDPVAIAWGADGKLWVAEMADYPLGIDGQGKPGGRVRYLEDRDGDGRYEKSTLFLAGLNFPTGVMPWKRGVLVTAAPEIFYAEDTDGDGRADRREAIYTGFVEGNQQHRVNGMRWGLDNWIHCANGDSGGTIVSNRTGKKIDISGRDFRIRPDTGDIESQTGRSQFGIDCDDWGNWFGSSNSRPLTHYVIPDEYLRRNPQAAVSVTSAEVPEVPGAAPIYPISKTVERFNDFDRANRFTSACGLCFYRDDLFGLGFAPGSMEGGAVGNAFICEPVHNLVHREVIYPKGSTFVGRRAPEEQKSEFLASRDPWFRPVMARTGPDGALYVVDMYRLVIEHPQWIPEGWQKKLDVRAGSDRGRIYRVVPKGIPPRKIEKLDRLDTAALVGYLHHPSGMMRDLAQQLLIERKDATAPTAIRALMKRNVPPQGTIHALCTLDGLDSINANDLLPYFDEFELGVGRSQVLNKEDSNVRRHVIRLSERFLGDNANLKKAMKFAQPGKAAEFQQILSLGAVNQLHDFTAAVYITDDDTFLFEATICSTKASNVERVLSGIFQPNYYGSFHKDDVYKNTLISQRVLIGRLARLIPSATSHDKSFVLAVTDRFLLEKERGYPLWQLQMTNGLLEGIEGKKLTWTQYTAAEPTLTLWLTEIEKLLEKLPGYVKDKAVPEDVRVAAISLLGRGPSDPVAARPILIKLLAPQEPGAVQQAAAKALVRQSDITIAEQLLDRWTTFSPPVRSMLLDSMLSRAPWTQLLFDRLESGKLATTELDAARRQRLLKSKDDSIRSRAEKLLAPAADRQKVIEAYADVLAMPGDKPRGLEVFRRRCSTCHKWSEVGVQVGPELLGMRDRSRPSLLTAILDPNRAVEAKYIGYTAITKDGLSYVGIIAAETATSITLLSPEGKQVELLRADLDELQSTSKSMMPEGLEKDLSRQDLADLLELLYTEPLKQVAAATALAPARIPPSPLAGEGLGVRGTAYSDNQLAQAPATKPAAASAPVAPPPVEAQPVAADVDEDEIEFRPGLVALYRDAKSHTVRRLDADVQFNWHGAAADERLAAGPLGVTWQGRLLSMTPGTYRLRAFAHGAVKLTLDKKTLLDGKSAQPGWLDAKPVDLNYGFHELAIEYSSAVDGAQIGLFWSGPQFQLEPIADRYYFHHPKQTPSQSFEQGRPLARALRCDACHSSAVDAALLAAPSLTHLAGNLDPAWINTWLSAKPAKAEAPAAPATQEATQPAPTETPAGLARRMPYLGLSADDSAAIAAALFDASAESAKPEKYIPAVPDKKLKKKPRTKPEAEAGQKLFNTVGCLACHRVGERGVLSLMGGGRSVGRGRQTAARLFRPLAARSCPGELGASDASFRAQRPGTGRPAAVFNHARACQAGRLVGRSV